MRTRKTSARPAGSVKSTPVGKTADGMPFILPQKVFSFPSEKQRAEEIAMRGLYDQLRIGHLPYNFSSYKAHPKQDGPDFNVVWNNGGAFVEITELAPLKGPYSTARRVFRVGEMAKLMASLVEKKNEKYKSRGYKPIFLLIYVTDDAFYVVEEVLQLLAKYLQIGKDLVFEAVFYLAFSADGVPHVRMPFPHDEELRFVNVERFANYQVINPDTAKYRVVEEDFARNILTIRQYLPEGAELSNLAPSVRLLLPGLEHVLATKKNET